MNLLRWIWLLCLAMVLPAWAQPTATHGAGRKRTAPLAMGAAFAPNGELWIVALNAQQQLFVQSSADEGRSWAKPRVLDTGADKIAADGENRPKLAFGLQGHVVISYTEPLARPYTGQIRMLRSADGGRSFSQPFTVHQDRQLITHRFESVAFDARGTLHTLWVDKRDMEALLASATANANTTASPAAVSPAPAPASAPRSERRTRPVIDYRGAAIYRNESTDGGRTFGPDIKLADHSCECCRIALAPAPDGSLVALWRHVFAPNQRDHAFAAVSGSGTSEPMRASYDRWAIDACPHHGPGLAPAADGGYHAVWFGDKAGQARVRLGHLDANGTPIGLVRELPDEAAEHAAIASAGASVVVVWRSYDGQATRWRAWVSSDGGNRFVLRELGRTTEDNDHPMLVQRGQQIFALWRTTQGVSVDRITP